MKLEEKVESVINEKIKELGFEIEYVEYVKEGEQYILRIVIDKVNSTVSIDDCELVSRSIENIVDSVIDKEYVLELSSPGIERELKNIKLYKKYMGKEVIVKLYKKIDNSKELQGILLDVNEENNSISLKLETDMLNISLADISSAHTVFDFSSELGKGKNQNLNQIKKF